MLEFFNKIMMMNIGQECKIRDDSNEETNVFSAFPACLSQRYLLPFLILTHACWVYCVVRTLNMDRLLMLPTPQLTDTCYFDLPWWPLLCFLCLLSPISPLYLFSSWQILYFNNLDLFPTLFLFLFLLLDRWPPLVFLHSWPFTWFFRVSMMSQTWAFKDIFNLKSFIRVHFNDTMNQINFILGKIFWKEKGFLHLAQNLILILALKRGSAFYKFEKENSQSPNIYFVRVGLAQDHLRCHVFDCTTECHPGLAISSEAEVTDLDIVFAIK